MLIPLSFHHTSKSSSLHFFLFCVVGFFLFFFFANFQHLVTKKNPVPIIQRTFVPKKYQSCHISKEFVLENHHVQTMGFSNLPQNCSKSIFLLFSLTCSQILLILVADDWPTKKLAKNKKNKKNFFQVLSQQ